MGERVHPCNFYNDSKSQKKKVVHVSCVCALFFWRGCDSISYKGIWKCMAGDLDLHKNLKSATGI